MNLIDQVRQKIDKGNYNKDQRKKLFDWIHRINLGLTQGQKVDVIARINSYVNSFHLNTVETHWQDPLSVVASGRATLNSFAITKYFTAYFSGIYQGRLLLGYANSPGKVTRLVMLYKPAPASEPYVLDYYYGSTTHLSQVPGMRIQNVFTMKEIFTFTDAKGINLRRVGHSVQIPEWNQTLLSFGVQFDEHREPVLIR